MDYKSELNLCLDSIDPVAYEKTRNFTFGKITKLSKFITHGVVNTYWVINYLIKNYELDITHKLINEVAWREYFQVVLKNFKLSIFTPFKPPLRDYQNYIPDDIILAQTGIEPIDDFINKLYAKGYLHNHERLWLSSYMIHFRGISWILGARWMYYYLLDGDIASNFLSWQWVAGTLNGKPYLFNKNNIEKYSKYKSIKSSILNHDYDYLIYQAKEKIKNIENKELNLSQKFDAKSFIKNSDTSPSKKQINIIHPWCLGKEYKPENIGILITEYHNKFLWSESRLKFVETIMKSNCDIVLVGDFENIKNRLKEYTIITSETFNPYYSELFEQLNANLNKTLFFTPYQMDKIESFSKFWRKNLKKIEKYN